MPDIARIFLPPKSQGPAPSFGLGHLYLSLMVIGESGPLGRQSLAARLGLGEGAVRTVLKHLRSQGYVEADASGCRLSMRGAAALKALKGFVPKRSITQEGFAILVRGAAQKVRSGIEQRDSAMKAGASGTITYTISKGKFRVPGGSNDCEKDFPSEVWSELRGLRPKEGDVVIITSAPDRVTAEIGGIAAALTLL